MSNAKKIDDILGVTDSPEVGSDKSSVENTETSALEEDTNTHSDKVIDVLDSNQAVVEEQTKEKPKSTEKPKAASTKSTKKEEKAKKEDAKSVKDVNQVDEVDEVDEDVVEPKPRIPLSSNTNEVKTRRLKLKRPTVIYRGPSFEFAGRTFGGTVELIGPTDSAGFTPVSFVRSGFGLVSGYIRLTKEEIEQCR